MQERFVLGVVGSGYNEAAVMGVLEEAVWKQIPGKENPFSPSIKAAIAMERRRGMPKKYTRTSGDLKLFRITVEEVP